jgi:hypothetical protein
MADGSLSIATKTRLATRIGTTFLIVHWRLRRAPLPQVVRSLGGRDGSSPRLEPRRLSRIVHRTLRLGRHHARCLVGALVLYRLLRAQGDEPELVIGLPETPLDHEAHAWVEVERVDVGPPPGKGSHEELARYR